MLAIANLGLWFARQVRKVHRAAAKLRNSNIDDSQVAEVCSAIIINHFIYGGTVTEYQYLLYIFQIKEKLLDSRSNIIHNKSFSDGCISSTKQAHTMLVA